MTNEEALKWFKPRQEYKFSDTCEQAEAIAIKAIEAVIKQRWRKFELREPDEEEKAEHPEWCYVMENTPDDGEEILVSNGRHVWEDEFNNDGDSCYLDSGHEMEDCWWMPLPEPPKEGDGNE